MDERDVALRSESEPDQGQIEMMQVDEELEFVRLLDVPDDVKAEVLERVEGFRETDEENASADGAQAE